MREGEVAEGTVPDRVAYGGVDIERMGAPERAAVWQVEGELRFELQLRIACVNMAHVRNLSEAVSPFTRGKF